MIGTRTGDLLMRSVEYDHLVDVLVSVLLHPLCRPKASTQVLSNLRRACDVARLSQDFVVGDVAAHLLLEHCP